MATYAETDQALIEFFRGDDLRRARWVIARHTPDRSGWCFHQGARTPRHKWPCRLCRCALEAVKVRLPEQMGPPL